MTPDLIEKLADAEHDSWARWMAYLFSMCISPLSLDPANSHDLIIPGELVERWRQQMDTPYAALSEREKESDRDEVRKILPMIEAAYSHNEPE